MWRWEGESGDDIVRQRSPGTPIIVQALAQATLHGNTVKKREGGSVQPRAKVKPRFEKRWIVDVDCGWTEAVRYIEVAIRDVWSWVLDKSDRQCVGEDLGWEDLGWEC